mgnify:CR=1 FL=1
MIFMKNSNPYPNIHENECKGCERCVLACPKNVIELSNDFNDAGYQYAKYKGEGCVGCKDCYYTCPEPLAIEIHNYKRKNNDIAIMIKYKTRGGKK